MLFRSSGLIDVTGGYNPYDDYGLITLGITGQYIDYGFLVDYTSYYDDYGPLSTLGTFGFIEKTTKSYNRSSIEVNQSSSDYGLVSVSVDNQDDLGGLPGTLVYDDYGSIKSVFDSSFIDDYGSIIASTTYDDYGSITNPVTVEGVFGVVADYGSLATPLTPFGTINISSGAVIRTEFPQVHTGSGTITISRPTPLGISSFIEKVTRSHAAIGLGTVNGEASNKIGRAHV